MVKTNSLTVSNNITKILFVAALACLISFVMSISPSYAGTQTYSASTKVGNLTVTLYGDVTTSGTQVTNVSNVRSVVSGANAWEYYVINSHGSRISSDKKDVTLWCDGTYYVYAGSQGWFSTPKRASVYMTIFH